MRALLAAAALGLLLLVPGALAEERVGVRVPYPAPDLRVGLNEEPGCASHELAWQGAWGTASDGAGWAWGGAPAGEAGGLDDRAQAWFTATWESGTASAEDAHERAPAWVLDDPFEAFWWADAALGSEDVCLLYFLTLQSGP